LSCQEISISLNLTKLEIPVDEVGNTRILSVVEFLRLGHEEKIVPDTA